MKWFVAILLAIIVSRPGPQEIELNAKDLPGPERFFKYEVILEEPRVMRFSVGDWSWLIVNGKLVYNLQELSIALND